MIFCIFGGSVLIFCQDKSFWSRKVIFLWYIWRHIAIHRKKNHRVIAHLRRMQFWFIGCSVSSTMTVPPSPFPLRRGCRAGGTGRIKRRSEGGDPYYSAWARDKPYFPTGSGSLSYWLLPLDYFWLTALFFFPELRTNIYLTILSSLTPRTN